MPVEGRGQKFKQLQLVHTEASNVNFVIIMRTELQDFCLHIECVHYQYEQVSQLKENLPSSHAVCQMDFAENYICNQAKEIQSAYFDKSSVTLHHVVYMKDPINDQLRYKSHIFVSDKKAHKATTVFAIM